MNNTETIDYKRMSEDLVSFMLNDWYNTERDRCVDEAESDHQKKHVTQRLASICYYDGYPVSEIIRLAERRNSNFSHLSASIDVTELESEITAKLEEYRN